MQHFPARRVALALALTSTLACSSGGTDPGTAQVTLRSTFNTVGTWVYQVEGEQAVPMLSGGPIVADTLRLRASGDGTWSIVARNPAPPPALVRSDIDIGWTPRRDTVFITPRCEPRERCDPLPGWFGTFAPSGDLVLLPSFRHQAIIAPRVYVRVAR
jgi:hypothetical protein